MAPSKTRPTDVDPADFLSGVIPPRRREDGLTLEQVFRQVTRVDPVMWGPSIVGYGSRPSSSSGEEWPIVGFSPRKARISLYGVKDSPQAAALLPDLGVYAEGAGCVYVNRLSDIDLDVLRQLIASAWQGPDRAR